MAPTTTTVSFQFPFRKGLCLVLRPTTSSLCEIPILCVTCRPAVNSNSITAVLPPRPFPLNPSFPSPLPAPLKVDCGLRAAVWTSTARGRHMTGPQLGAVYEDAWDLAYREGLFKITLGQYKEM